MASAPDRLYCISCGEEVPVKVMSIGIEGEELVQCSHCHSFLGSVKQPLLQPDLARLPRVERERPGDFSPDETAGKADLPDLPGSMSTPSQAAGGLDLAGEEEAELFGGPPLETVITVEDSSLISAILNDMLVGEGLTKRVIPCKNGYEFLGRYLRERSDQRSRLGLVVMDVKMPVLNGVSAAVAMRAHENALELEPAPILFFTSQRCDELFRKVLLHCAPAMYINKGASNSPTDLQNRIGKVIRQLLNEQW